MEDIWLTDISMCIFVCDFKCLCICLHTRVCVYACQQLRGERGGGMGLEERLEKESLGLGDNPAQKALLFGE